MFLQNHLISGGGDDKGKGFESFALSKLKAGHQGQL